MINKQNLWFITLFSIILVLSIYYVTISDDTLTKIINENNTQTVSNIDNQVEIVETANDELSEQRESKENDEQETLNTLQSTLLSEETTIEEKNDAYESIKQINKNKEKEENLEKIIKEEYKLNSIVKISGEEITITISQKEHSKELANTIIRRIQQEYEKEIYISIKFQSNN